MRGFTARHRKAIARSIWLAGIIYVIATRG